jgi:phosphoglycolate phosphatase-like HAD superfamily hydrolase
MSSSSRPIVIFDFDGTLADSLQLVIGEYNRVAPFYRAKRVNASEVPRLRTLKANVVLREHNISFWKLPLLVSHMRYAMRSQVDLLQPFAGVVEALRGLHAAGLRCSVLSTNSKGNIARFLRRHDVQVFDPVAGGASTFGKARALRALIARQGWPRERVVYVGDEVRDIEAARQAQIRSLAVSWGFADRNALLAHHPWQLADRPEQLLTLLAEPPTQTA